MSIVTSMSRQLMPLQRRVMSRRVRRTDSTIVLEHLVEPLGHAFTR